MTYGIPFLIEYLTGFATLYPGDLILTGSPGGTETLHPGDQIDIEIDGIGTLTNGVVGADRPEPPTTTAPQRKKGSNAHWK